MKLWLVILATSLLCLTKVQAGLIGANINADADLMKGNYAAANPLFTVPLYNQPGVNPTAFWDNMVEQYDASQLDFVAIWLKGNKQPTGMPAAFAGLVAAINKRGIADRLKVMPFDDNPASWTAQWNLDHGRGYGYAQPFDLSNTNDWVYIWDNNFKVFFQNVPDANRQKFNGRPVICFWSLAPLFVSNVNGNASKLLLYLRAQCQATFGFNPYITVPIEWIQHDPTSNNTNCVDAVRPWFVPVVGSGAYSSWNTYTWNGVTLGCAVPGYHGNGANDFSLWIDPNHGLTLSNGLQHTIAPSAMTFVEGIDDMWECATTWRARNLDTAGNALSYTQMGYQDYPNQRINVLRKFSSHPFPADLKMEAEGCDTFGGGVGGGNGNNYYRNGPISIYPCTDTYGGHHVGNVQAGQWLEWQEVPLQGSFHINVRVATTGANSQLHFVIDGTSYPAITLPNTGGAANWQTVDTGAYVFPNNSYHTVRLVCDTAGFNVNFWQLAAGAVTPTPPTTPGGLTAIPGNAQVLVNWLASANASGYNLKRASSSNGTYTTIAANLPGLTYPDTAVSNSLTYYYRISATNSFGESTNSPAVSATPSLAAALVTWFKADAVSGVNHGAGLAVWSDLSGNGNNATQGVAGSRPLYLTNAVNGLPGVRFNASNLTHLIFNRTVQDDFTLLCVFRSTQGISTGTNFFNGAGLVNGEMPGVTEDFGTALNANGRILAGVGHPDLTLISSNGFNDGKPHLFTFKRVRSSGLVTLYVDGVLAGSATGGTQSFTAPPRLVLGAQQTLLNYFTGDLAEVKLYTTPLADLSRQSEEASLLAKYAIGVTSPILTATRTNQSVRLTWPAAATGFTLRSATNLTPPVSWLVVSNTPVLSNTQWQVTLSLSNSTRKFFRLQQP